MAAPVAVNTIEGRGTASECDITAKRHIQWLSAVLRSLAESPPGGNRQPMIEVSELKKTYNGGGEAVKGISFEVHARGGCGLPGPNGGAKATTLRVRTTTTRATSGSARPG